MNKKLHKLLSGVAITTLGATACIIPMTGAVAGEIPQKGVYGWGANSSGLLGNGTATQANVPTLTASSIVDTKEVATSDTHTLFLDRNGNVYASGKNTNGQLGNGTTASSTKPVKVTLPLRFGVPDYATQIWVGDNVSYMRGSYGDLYSWGSNDRGRTGQGVTTGNVLTPKKVGSFIVEDDKNQLSISDTQVAFIAERKFDFDGNTYETSALYTFGSNAGQVANQNSTATVVSTPTLQLISDPDEDLTYDREVCVLDKSPEAEPGDTICDYVLTKKTYNQFMGLQPTRVSVGNDFGIATDGSTLFTWGKNNKGQLGRSLSTATVSPKPTSSSALLLENGASPVSISAGDEHALVLGSDGLIYGWGDNSRSETAPYYTGTTGTYLNVLQRLVIQKEVADTSSWEEVYASNDSSYATTSDSQVYGWGDNSTKELAHSNAQVTKPTRISFPYETEIVNFSAAGNSAVAVTEYTEVYKDLALKNTGNTISGGTAHTAYNYTVASVGGYPGKAHRWTIYGLPKGLTYSATTGKISGTPTQVGTFNVEVNVNDNVDDVSQTYTMKIAKAAPTLTAKYAATSVPGKATAKIKVVKGSYAPNGASFTLTYGTKKVTGKLNAKGEATVALSGTAGAKVSTKVTFAGNATLNAASASSSVTFAKKRAATVTATYSAPHPGQVKAVVTVKDVKANATGYVYLKSGSAKSSKAKLVNGKATVTWGGRGYGKSAKVAVVYEGSGNNAAKTLATKTVKTKSKYSSVPGVKYTVKAKKLTTVVSVGTKSKLLPTGKVYLYDGKKKVATGNLSKGKVTFKTTLKKGTHKMKVTFAGNTYYNAKTSSVKSVKIK